MVFRKRLLRYAAVLVAIITAVFFAGAEKAFADSPYDYENPDTGDCVRIFEESDIMSDEDEDIDLAIAVFDEYFEAIDSSDRQIHYESEDEELTEEEGTGEEASSSEKISRKNTETGYEALILDDADLLTESEENRLFEEMMPITQYANCVFYSSNTSNGEPEQAVRSKYLDIYESNSVSGVMFFVDMKNRQLVLCGAGDDITSIVTSSKCDSIMDNVYRYASDKDYYSCARETFRESYTLLEGGQINEPMRVTSNAFLAVIFGMLLAYGIVRRFSTVSKPSEKELLAAINARQQLNNYRKIFERQTKYMIRQVLRPPAEEAVVAEEAVAPSQAEAMVSKCHISYNLERINK